MPRKQMADGGMVYGTWLIVRAMRYKRERRERPYAIGYVALF
ncbi:MAG: hypothetical protein ACREO5_00905 [Candidatus Binatia bacterium]